MVTVRARHRRGGEATAEHNRRPKPLIGLGLRYRSEACCSVYCFINLYPNSLECKLISSR